MIKRMWRAIKRFFKWLFFWKKPEVKTYKDLLEKILAPFTAEEKTEAYRRWIAAFILDDQEQGEIYQLENCFEGVGQSFSAKKAQALILPLVKGLMSLEKLQEIFKDYFPHLPDMAFAYDDKILSEWRKEHCKSSGVDFQKPDANILEVSLSQGVDAGDLEALCNLTQRAYDSVAKEGSDINRWAKDKGVFPLDSWADEDQRVAMSTLLNYELPTQR